MTLHFMNWEKFAYRTCKIIQIHEEKRKRRERRARREERRNEKRNILKNDNIKTVEVIKDNKYQKINEYQNNASGGLGALVFVIIAILCIAGVFFPFSKQNEISNATYSFKDLAENVYKVIIITAVLGLLFCLFEKYIVTIFFGSVYLLIYLVYAFKFWINIMTGSNNATSHVKIGFYMMFVGGVSLVIYSLICNLIKSRREFKVHSVATERDIPINISSEDACKMRDYNELVRLLRKNGFVNITINAKYDLVFGIINEDKSVESITVDNKENFNKGDIFSSKADIIIVFHTFKSNNQESFL